MLSQIDIVNQPSQLLSASSSVPGERQVTQRFDSILVSSRGLSDCLCHFLEQGFGLRIVVERSEGELFGDVLGIVGNAILAS